MQCHSWATIIISFPWILAISLINFCGIDLAFQIKSKGNTKSSHIPSQFPLLLTSHIHMVQLSQLINNTDILLLTKVNTLVRLPQFLPNIFLLFHDPMYPGYYTRITCGISLDSFYLWQFRLALFYYDLRCWGRLTADFNRGINLPD